MNKFERTLGRLKEPKINVAKHLSEKEKNMILHRTLEKISYDRGYAKMKKKYKRCNEINNLISLSMSPRP